MSRQISLIFFILLCIFLLLQSHFHPIYAEEENTASSDTKPLDQVQTNNDNNNNKENTNTVDSSSSTETTPLSPSPDKTNNEGLPTTENKDNIVDDTKDTVSKTRDEEEEAFARAKDQEMKEIEEAFERPEVEPLIPSEEENNSNNNDNNSNPSSISSNTDNIVPENSESSSSSSSDTETSTTDTSSVTPPTGGNKAMEQPQPQQQQQGRQNKRTAPRDEEIFNRLIASKSSSLSKKRSTQETGTNENILEDDYYGLNMNPVDNLDRAVFQPSHIFSLEIEPGGMMEFFEDIEEDRVGVVIRGDWFVTSGDELNLQTVIHDPSGSRIYSEGPDTPLSDDSGYTYNKLTSDGSFKFRTDQPGTYRLTFFNPSYSTSRTVTFAWLVGKDDDDPYTKKYLDRVGKTGTDNSNKNYNKDIPAKDTKMHNELTYATVGMNKPTNASATVVMMLKRVSSLHKDIDDITAVQQFADVRFQRHYHTLENTRNRLTYWTLAETLAVIIAASLQIYMVKSYNYVMNPRPSYYIGV